MIFFGKLAYDQGWLGRISPTFRCLAIAAAGFAALFAAEVARKRLGTSAAAALYAVGLASLYISPYVAHAVFELINSTTLFVLLTAAVAIAAAGVATAALGQEGAAADAGTTLGKGLAVLGAGLAIVGAIEALQAGLAVVMAAGAEVQTTVSAREGAGYLARASHWETERDIDEFVRFLAVEKGLSDNYQLSVRSSLEAFSEWASKHHGVTETKEVTLDHLTDYLAHR